MPRMFTFPSVEAVRTVEGIVVVTGKLGVM